MSRIGELAGQDGYDAPLDPLAEGGSNVLGGILNATGNVAKGLYRDIPRAANWFYQQAGKPEAEAQADVRNVMGGLAEQLYTLPKRTMGASQDALDTGIYNPAPAVETALTIMGGGVAGTGEKAGATLGAGIVRPTYRTDAALGSPIAAPKTLFDYSRLGDVPNVAQFDRPRDIPPRGVPQRTLDITNDPAVRDKMLEVISQGQKMGGSKWYNAEPLREAFNAELGKGGDAAFRKYMDMVAATSPRSDVGTNARNASYYYSRAMRGEPMPAVGDKNPQPYGHMAQRLHQMNAERVAGPGWDPLNNPKPASFVENLVGNQMPATIDTHAFRLPAILGRDPRFLETAFQVSKDAPKQNIQKMLQGGEVSMDDAAARAAFWQAQPKANEYGAMERYYRGLGNELGLTPAQTQASAWVGGGKITGLASDESKPFLRFLEDRINLTAEKKGEAPEKILKKFIRGDVTLGSGATDKKTAGAIQGIRAYHSSLHDFDKFDLSKIGTGEGAQAYGHGLYFAENPAVSGQGGEYWKQFANRFEGAEAKAARALEAGKFDREAAINLITKGMERQAAVGSPPEAGAMVRARQAIDLLKSGKPVGPRTYEVNINADPAHMLDWDKPIGQQPHVWEGLHNAGHGVPKRLVTPDDLTNLRTKYGDWGKLQADALQDVPNWLGERFRPHSIEQAQKMAEAGIPGIKYLDQGSRFSQALYNNNPIANEARRFVEAAGGNSEKAAELFYKSNPAQSFGVSERDEIRRLIQMAGNKPTSNYVIFDPSRIRIDKKYAVPGAIGAGGMGALAAQDRYE